MRTLLPLSLLAAVLASALVLTYAPAARSDEGSPASLPELLVKRLERAERAIGYLRQREQRLSAYVLASEQRADALKRLAADLRAGGFAAAANPSPARERLLAGMEQMAAALLKDLPKLSDEEKNLLESVK